ncbi:MAG: hypothetical protein Q7N50_10855 [Armatimonadota bacterium]|nr:hypothetical protein [Armatimonadota bacterium]
MSMLKLNLTPTAAAYTATDGEEAVSARLDGGGSRFGRGIPNSASSVTAQWQLNGDNYKLLRAFFNTTTSRGSEPFFIDLILDQPSLTEHTAYFVPNSFKLTGVDGTTFTAVAVLDVIPVKPDADFDEALVGLTNSFGFGNINIDAGLLSLEALANVDLAAIEPE